jgi:tetratricopeptide (TPR) repeat protein
MKSVLLVARATLVLALAAFWTSALADALTDRAKALLQQKQHRQAYDLLLPQEASRAGDPEFDYLLGIAAIDSGEPERGVFALERVLAVQPNNHVARAEIARAYLALGERDSARREFETVRAQQVPPEVKQAIDGYLSAISAAEVTQLTGFIEAGFGHDSNVNSATGGNQIAVPSLGGIVATLDPASTRNADTFTMLAAGLNLTHKVAKEWALVGSLGANAKLNTHQDEFDTLTLDATAGVRWSRGNEAITLAGQFQDFELDYARYRETKGLVAQWQHTLDERSQFTLYGQLADLHYPTQDIRDSTRSVLGAAYGHVFSGTYTPVLFVSAYGGQEKVHADGVPHLGDELYGVRIGGPARLGIGWTVFSNLAYEYREYGGPDPLFLVIREDKQLDFTFGLSYLLRPNTTLIAQYAYTDVDSNIPINSFTRNVGTVSLRFNF